MDIHLDFETYSQLDLTEVGLMNYVTHPSTRVLLAAFGDREGNYIKQLTHEDGFDRLQQAIQAPDVLVHAWNAPFEWAVMRYVLGWPVDIRKMHCTMAHALYRGFPGKLDKAAKVFGLPGKPADSTRLLNLWSMGRGRPKPGDWDRFCEYNINDVVMEREVARRLEPYPWPKHERDIWLMGEEINLRGAPVNVPAAISAIDLHDKVTRDALAAIHRLTGVSNPNSTAQLSKWLGVKSLNKKALPELKKKLTGTKLEVLELRERVALSAPKKYTVAVRQAHHGRLYGMLQYSGAGRTHRWSGRGLQPQNLRRGWKDDEKIADAWRCIQLGLPMQGDVFNALADLVRSIIHPAEGLLAVADYSSIEVVMLHWLAGDEDMLHDLRAGLDAYKRFAAAHFRKPIEAVTKDERTFAKPVVLGAGYGLGAGTLVEYAQGYGVEMDEVTAKSAIYAYRSANRPVVALWDGLERAMRAALAKPGKRFRYGHASFKVEGEACLCRLPSGSEITYWNARVTEDGLAYDGVDQKTGHWSTIRTWGARLTENLVQSISRDVLVHGLQQAGRRGLPVVLHVHDEIVVETRQDDPDTVLQDLLSGMGPAPWCPDAPVKAAGFTCPRYRKD